MKNSLRYFIAFTIILITEICIALFFTDTFIRPIFGDFLAVILVYCFGMFVVSLFSKPNFKWKKKLLLISLGIAIAIETLQAFPFLEMMGLEENKIATIILGSTFDWWDVLAYLVGALVVYGVEIYLSRRH
ncbi:DUF2809 domain-containing protein [Dokdonia sinensis]|uniref:DUF2809 domain-containing protein n=1 Tax=Dokdonia sinensis TaxID=2479847 RepID=A0A3M0G516_9FLAO|nr:DUF2809 domain-containing protein [Dokdonia sinensis]RMB56259.1 DUF2809 domain-containing protein [Dokdonia sinensis]